MSEEELENLDFYSRKIERMFIKEVIHTIEREKHLKLIKFWLHECGRGNRA